MSKYELKKAEMKKLSESEILAGIYKKVDDFLTKETNLDSAVKHISDMLPPSGEDQKHLYRMYDEALSFLRISTLMQITTFIKAYRPQKETQDDNH